jgi:1,4-dihydroxy-2-naphthoate octaprenyltransferase
MTRTEIDNALQWTGTACILAMYVLMNFYRDLKLDPLFGLLGGVCYLAWTLRVRNRPQMLVNAVAITVCAVGLFKAWG